MPLPSSDATATDSAACSYTDPTIGVADADLLTGTAYSGMFLPRTTLANCRSGDTLHAADTVLVTAPTSAHYWTANSATMAGSVHLLNGS
jgi:hypothetical protein